MGDDVSRVFGFTRRAQEAIGKVRENFRISAVAY